MDPLTQTAVGAVAAAALTRGGRISTALLVGAVAGASPDIDVLIRSSADPLLGLQFHRHFTHSLFFVPVVALIIAGLFKLLYRRKHEFGELFFFAVLGAATHGPIDACTSYGTMLYWPFIDHRESWDIISIIDPIFTLPILCFLLLALCFRKRIWAQIGFSFCLIYLAFGLFQRERGEDYIEALAASRGHVPTEISVRPSFANLIVWRLIYREGDDYHVNAVNLTPGKKPVFYEGRAVAAFTENDARALASEDSVLLGDIQRFRFFSQGFLYPIPGESFAVGDLRYATLPNSTRPLWGIRFDPGKPEKHVRIEYFREASKRAFRALWTMIRGRPLEPEHRRSID